jgi:hypothetical protein
LAAVAVVPPAAKPFAEPPAPPPQAAPPEPPPPLAAAEPSPPAAQAAPPAEKPNSVFGWGPWAGQPQSPGASGETPAGDVPSASGVLPGVSVAANAGSPNSVNSTGTGGGGVPPPVVPPSSNSNVRPGHGFGDRNHTHVHGKGR